MQRRLPGLPPDYAIQQRIVKENKLANAEAYDLKMKQLGINSGWFERNQQSSKQKILIQNDKQIKAEINFTWQEIQMRRRVRLMELYESEMSMYEKELNEKGLSLVKERL